MFFSEYNSCADPEHFGRGVQLNFNKVFCVDKRERERERERERIEMLLIDDHHQPASVTKLKRRFAGGRIMPALNASLVVLWISRGSGQALLMKPCRFVIFQVGEGRAGGGEVLDPVSPLDPRMKLY